MSWLLGFVAFRPEGRTSNSAFRPEGRTSNSASRPDGRTSDSASLSPAWRERLASFGAASTHESISASHYILCGGLEETCRGGTFGDGGNWFVVGTAIRTADGRCRILRGEDWQRLLSPSSPDLRSLGGGFIALRTRGSTVDVFSDTLGVRTFYWSQLDDGILFSTRLDWISALKGGAAVDYSALGSHWLAFNQIGYRSLVGGIDRLPPGGRVQIDSGGARMTAGLWHPTESKADAATLLRSYLLPQHDRTLSLGLSGGLDSRALLALRPGNASFEAHTFGPLTRADVRIAHRLARTANVPLRHYDSPQSSASLDEVARHAIVSQAVSPISGSIYLSFYRNLHEDGRLVVDGGFGEVMRRQFMNRLLRNGREALTSRNAAGVLPHIAFDRGSFFDPAIIAQMHRGALVDLQGMIDDLPGSLQPEDMVDLLAVWTRLPNFFGFEQARLDGLVLSYMPFAQPDVLDAVFSLKPARRVHGRYTRSIIGGNDPLLQRHPLVKGGTTYPYRLPASMATPFVLLRKRLLPSPSSESAAVLKTLREPVLDRVQSHVVRSCSAYDYPTLVSSVEAFYATGHNAAHVDWWLAFDLWREAVERGVLQG